MPTGAALASVMVEVDTTFGGGDLAVLLKTATFLTPVYVNAAFCLVIDNNTSNSLGIVHNSWTAGDGKMQWLASANLFGTWFRSFDVLIGPSPYDADALFHPNINYDITANFTASTQTLVSPTLVSFTNASSPIFANKMYNQTAFSGLEALSYTWDFDDGSPLVNAIDTMHLFPVGTYKVHLYDTLFGWQNNCTADTCWPLAPLEAGFSFSINTLEVTFSDTSTGPPTSWLWDFGDGNISIEQNPVHKYASPGNYTVCLTVINIPAADSSCASVTATEDIFGICCPTTLTIDDDPILGGTYTAQNTITASTQATSDIVFKAGQEIQLNSNFEILPGVNFEVILENCLDL